MSRSIGETAGQVWQFLHERGGEASASQIIRRTGLPRDLIQRAIGWLAREDKLEVVQATRRTQKLRLR